MKGKQFSIDNNILSGSTLYSTQHNNAMGMFGIAEARRVQAR